MSRKNWFGLLLACGVTIAVGCEKKAATEAPKAKVTIEVPTAPADPVRQEPAPAIVEQHKVEETVRTAPATPTAPIEVK